MPRRWILICLASFLLWALLSQANHYLAPAGIYLSLGGLFLTFGALRLRPYEGLAIAFFSGLLHDAARPVAFGTHAFLFAAAAAFACFFRHRIPREERLVGLLVALLTNLAIFAALSLLPHGGRPRPAEAWSPLLVDLLASQAAILLVGGWFFAFQVKLLAFVGVDLRAEPRGLP